jgi:hypothetical protein
MKSLLPFQKMVIGKQLITKHLRILEASCGPFKIDTVMADENIRRRKSSAVVCCRSGLSSLYELAFCASSSIVYLPYND